MRKQEKASWGVALLGVLALAGCGGNANNSDNSTDNGASTSNAAATNSSTGTSGDDLKSVTIGYNPAIVQPQPLIGVEEGEYGKRISGVTFEGQQFKAGPDVVQALRANAVQIGCSGIGPPLKAYSKDGDIVMICGAATGGTELSVAGNSAIKTLKDLKGKTIGVNQLGSTVDAMVRYNLIKAGLTPDKDVRIIAVDPPQQADSLQRGGVDAVAAPAPWPSQAQVKAKARTLLDWKTILDNGNYLAGSIYTTKAFAQAHPEFIKKFVEANKAITDDLNKDAAKGNARVLAAWSKVSKKTLPPDVAKRAFATIHFTTEAKEADLQRFADLTAQVGLSKKADLEGFVFQAK